MSILVLDQRTSDSSGKIEVDHQTDTCFYILVHANRARGTRYQYSSASWRHGDTSTRRHDDTDTKARRHDDTKTIMTLTADASSVLLLAISQLEYLLEIARILCLCLCSASTVRPYVYE